MIENIQAMCKNGVLHPLKPLDLPKDKIVEIEVRDVSEADKSTNAGKIKRLMNG